MRVLITGGAGFIGSHIAEMLQPLAEVRVLDDLRTGRLSNLDGLKVVFDRGSILDRHRVHKAMEGVDIVFHLAALASVPESIARPHECVALNVSGLLTVLEEAVASGVKKLCFSSSAAVYGNNPKVPKEETMLPEPQSPYAITKLDGEYYCRQFCKEGRLETVCLRFFNVFGPRQDPESAYSAAVPIFIKQALTGEPITIFGDGSQTRDFIYVKDVAAACIFSATNPGITGVYNVGNGGDMTILGLARKIIGLAGSHSKIRHVPRRAGDVQHSRADIRALRSAGFSPASSIDAGLAATLNHFRQQ
jgi:UDP-glucose 4-epimerase